MIPQDGTAVVLLIAFYVVAVPLAFALVCWPLTAYANVFWVTNFRVIFSSCSLAVQLLVKSTRDSGCL